MHNVTSPNTSDEGIEAEIVAKGLTAPRVTPADLEANIVSEAYFTADQATTAAGESYHNAQTLLTICVLVLRNGFTVTGTSACASPENFDAEVGRKIARDNATRQVWPLMGYALREKLQPGEQYALLGMKPYQVRVCVERDDLTVKQSALDIFASTDAFDNLPDGEQQRMFEQAAAMKAYADILNARIAAFDIA